jgi:hypothetical protein
MKSNDPDLLNLVNASGFLFQLKVQQEISATTPSHGKSVLAREHRWKHQQSGQEGFIDLIVSAGTNGKIIVECKRVRDARWVFLVPEEPRSTTSVRILWTMKFSQDHQGSAWDRLDLQRDSFESEFCIVRGQADRDRPMLERLSSVLLSSVEAIAEEELQYDRPIGTAGLRFYFPALVTSASLYVCRVRPDEIDLSSGELKDAVFEEVPFVRFTKSMTTALGSSHSPSHLADAVIEGRRTVFVVNAQQLVHFLTGGWEFESPLSRPWPWDLPTWSQIQG